jgi:DNA primase
MKLRQLIPALTVASLFFGGCPEDFDLDESRIQTDTGSNTSTGELMADIAVITQNGTVEFEIWNDNFTSLLLSLEPEESLDYSAVVDAGDYIVGVRALESVELFNWEMTFSDSVCGNGETEWQ